MGQFANGKRPQLKTIQEAVNFLGELGLSVYGGNLDLSDGEMRCGCRDYSAIDIVRIRELTEKDMIYDNNDTGAM